MTKRSVALVGVLVVMAMIGSSVIGAVSAWATSDAANGTYSVFLPLIMNAIGAMAEVPQGAVMTFNLTSCPSGWTEVTAAQGMSIVGMPSGGTLEGTVGASLTDLGSLTITDVPEHMHGVNPPQWSTNNTGSHDHWISIPNGTAWSAGSHVHSNHPPLGYTGSAGDHNHDLGHNAGNAGGGANAFQIAGDTTLNWVTDTEPPHTHSVIVPTYDSGLGGQHTHQVDIPSAYSSPNGNHTHTIDLPATLSESAGSPSVDVTMPYIQFLVCEKD